MQINLTPKQVVRFWSKVDRSGGPDSCWEWTGARNDQHYGVIRNPSRPPAFLRAHRVAWELEQGPIPEGLFVLHRCDNPPCCNPAHLFIGTKADNTHDMMAKGRGDTSGLDKILTADQVREIRSIHASGAMGYRKLGKAYGVSMYTIRALIVGRSWRGIE